MSAEGYFPVYSHVSSRYALLWTFGDDVLAPGSPVLRNIFGSDIGKVELMALSTCCRHGWRDGGIEGGLMGLSKTCCSMGSGVG